MKRFDLDWEFKARSMKEAARKAAKFYRCNSLNWVADELQDCAENGYYYSCNATISNTFQYSEPLSPSTSDWTYYWAIEELGDGIFYTWFIEREDL